jgi:hypothetical protein
MGEGWRQELMCAFPCLSVPFLPPARGVASKDVASKDRRGQGRYCQVRQQWLLCHMGLY